MAISGALLPAVRVELTRAAARMFYWIGERAFAGAVNAYERSLPKALQWPGLTLLGLLATLGFTVNCS